MITLGIIVCVTTLCSTPQAGRPTYCYLRPAVEQRVCHERSRRALSGMPLPVLLALFLLDKQPEPVEPGITELQRSAPPSRELF